MAPTLDLDCWDGILQQLLDDHRTLSRLLQVSKFFFTMVTPLLYGNIYTAENSFILSHWSDYKRRRVFYMLLMSSGFIAADHTMLVALSTTPEDEEKEVTEMVDGIALNSSDESRDQQQLGAEIRKEIRVVSIGNENMAYMEPLVDTWRDSLQLPFTIPYWKHVKCFPDEPFHELSWRHWNNSLVDCYFVGRIYSLHHAEMIPKIRTSPKDLALNFLSHVKNFQSLTELVLEQDMMDQEEEDELGADERRLLRQQIKEGCFEFIKIHKQYFPGLLRKVISSLGEFFVPLNRILEPIEMSIHSYSNQSLTIPVFGSETTSWDSRDKAARSDPIAFRNLKSLDILETFDEKSVSHLGCFLQNCQKLESLKIICTSRTRNTGLDWKSVLGWAVVKGKEERKRSSTTITTVGALGRDGFRLGLKELSLSVPETSVILHGLDGFRSTLESVFVFEKGNAAITWSWMLPRLKSLSLSHCTLDFSSLEKYCPNLKNLELVQVLNQATKLMTVEEQKANNGANIPLWKLPLGLESVKVLGSGMESLDFESLSKLAPTLKGLCFQMSESRSPMAKRAAEQIAKLDMLAWEEFLKLKQVQLEGTAVNSWQLRWWDVAPNLVRFELGNGRSPQMIKWQDEFEKRLPYWDGDDGDDDPRQSYSIQSLELADYHIGIKGTVALLDKLVDIGPEIREYDLDEYESVDESDDEPPPPFNYFPNLRTLSIDLGPLSKSLAIRYLVQLMKRPGMKAVTTTGQGLGQSLETDLFEEVDMNFHVGPESLKHFFEPIPDPYPYCLLMQRVSGLILYRLRSDA